MSVVCDCGYTSKNEDTSRCEQPCRARLASDDCEHCGGQVSAPGLHYCDACRQLLAPVTSDRCYTTEPVDTNPKRFYGDKKPPIHFIPPVAILEEAQVMKLGARKYGPFNWTKDPVSASTYYSAAMRHLMAWYTGEQADLESGCNHLAHARACLAILLDCEMAGTLHDDRPADTTSASATIARLSDT